ncbi:response regulator transcription factor [Perlucidibaca aquatica]|uniref:response regulator transcription factor n=1 Tax=Perlucidibaca aquatica TaxID=1852776 RepID=UPI00083AB025|nr:response regulator [Perlucidibaca aquatica]
MKILLIDDDAIFRQTLARTLTRRGCVCVEAADSAQALLELQAHLPDACVLDLRMGNESGLQLLPQLLAIKPELNVLMLTGYSSIATTVEAIKRGAVNYLAKPASADDILRALKNASSSPDLEPRSAGQDALSVDRLAWEHIQRVLLEEDGNISSTARRLNMHRRTLQRRLSKRPVSQ